MIHTGDPYCYSKAYFKNCPNMGKKAPGRMGQNMLGLEYSSFGIEVPHTILGHLVKSTDYTDNPHTYTLWDWSSTKLRPKQSVLKSRSSHRRCFVKKGALRNFAKFTGKHLY